MNYWFLFTQNYVYPTSTQDEDLPQSFYLEDPKTVIVVTEEDKIPSKLMNDANWIGTSENADGIIKITMLMGWSQLNESYFQKVKSKVDIIWYASENKWEWPLSINESDIDQPSISDFINSHLPSPKITKKKTGIEKNEIYRTYNSTYQVLNQLRHNSKSIKDIRND